MHQFRIYEATWPSKPNHIFVGAALSHTDHGAIKKEHEAFGSDVEVSDVYIYEGTIHTAKFAVAWRLQELCEARWVAMCGRDMKTHEYIGEGMPKKWEFLNEGMEVACENQPSAFDDMKMERAIGGARLKHHLKYSVEAVRWAVEKYRSLLHEDRKGNGKAPCERCGFECANKHLKRHQASSRCKNRHDMQHLSDEQKLTRECARRDNFNAKQNAKIACPLCGVMTVPRNLARHQAGYRCAKRALASASAAGACDMD